MSNATVDKHPSYAVIRVTHPTGGNGRLFGSPLLHDHRVAVEICEAESIRESSEDRVYAEKLLIRVEMSEEQYARFVAGRHTHSGVPCTLTRIGGQQIESPPMQAKVDRHYQEARDKADEAIAMLDRLTSKLDVLLARLPARTRSEVLSEVRSARQRLADHMPWVVQMMHENMTKIVEQSKIEIEAFLRRSVGSLSAAAPVLELPGKID